MNLLDHSHGGVVAMAYASKYPTHIRRLVLASTLARFHEPQRQAMKAAMAKRKDEPWYEDALEALEQEQAGEFTSDAELAELAVRESGSTSSASAARHATASATR